MTSRLDVQAVVREVFEIYRSQATVLLPAAAVIFFFTALIALVLSGSLVGVLVLLAIQTLAAILYAGMVVNLVRDVQDGRRDSSVGDLFRAVVPVIVPLLVAGLLIGLAFGIGLALLIIPGILVLTVCAVVPPVVLLERPGVLQSFGRSWELVRPNFWRVFGAVLLFFVIFYAVTIILRSIGTAAGDGGLFVGSFIASVLTAPLSALVSAVLYFQLFATKEATAPPATADTGATTATPAAPESPQPGTQSPSTAPQSPQPGSQTPPDQQPPR